MRGKLTMKYLVDWMQQAQSKDPQQRAEVTIFCSEFKVFARGTYADSGLIEDLTHLYDCGIYEYRTGGQGVYIVEKPCVNLLAASTPEWLTTGSAADFIGGGFSSRIVPVALLKDEKLIAWPDKTQVVKTIETSLINDLIAISKVEGPFMVTQDGKNYFERWYKIRQKYELADVRMAGFYSKKHDLVLKLAMILAISVSDDLFVTEEHIETAVQLLGKLELNIPFAFQGVAWGEQAKFQDRVLTKIKEGEIQHSILLQNFKYCMTGADLKQIISSLIDMDVITWTKKEGKTIYSYKGGKDESK